jgi:hypothetical protein
LGFAPGPAQGEKAFTALLLSLDNLLVTALLPRLQLVFQLEQDMVMSEFKVAYANDETEQRRLERLSANAAQLG